MVTIEGSTTIARPVKDVFDFVADERNEPTYNPKMTSVDKLTPGPIGKGTRWSATVDSRGRPVEMELEVTDYDRPHRLASTTTMAAAQIQGALTFEPGPAGTVMRWSWDLRPKGAFRLLGPLFAAQGRRQEAAIWAGLKRAMEGDGPAAK
jgi:uncharacterized protein YndB with AHSA1/START domain